MKLGTRITLQFYSGFTMFDEKGRRVPKPGECGTLEGRTVDGALMVKLDEGGMVVLDEKDGDRWTTDERS
jgi:hypothetical protein